MIDKARMDPLPLPISRCVVVRQLSREEPTTFDIEPEAGELAELCRFLDVRGLDSVRLQGRLLPWQQDGWELEARLQARVSQTCVVTLDEVVTRFDQPVVRQFLPAAAMPRQSEVLVDPEEDGPDPLTNEIDLGLVLTEALALAIDPYPRREGAELESRVFSAPGTEPLTDETARPFASLAGLREKLRGR